MLDWNRIRELRTEVGDDEFKLILELSLDEVEDVMIRLNAQRGERLAGDLHFLKGCAWNLGFQGFGAMCDQGERLAATDAATTVDLDAMLACYASSKQMMIQGLETDANPQRARIARG